MPKKRSWTEDMLRSAVLCSRSRRQVLVYLGLFPAGGNYAQIKKYIKEYSIDTSHFSSQGWKRGRKGDWYPHLSIDQILVQDSNFQSYHLKQRLFKEGLKKVICEECGWAKKSEDGRIPLELDHINGDSRDNRIENLRVLCPNCHSLKPTHRGRNRK